MAAEPGPEPAARMAAVALCVLDVDGTLLTSRHEVAAVTRREVLEARAEGLEVLLATSRGPAALRPVLDALGDPVGTPFVASQGAVLGSFDASAGLDVLAHRPAPLDEALAAVRLARRLGLSVGWYSLADWLVPTVDAAVAREAEITHTTPRVTDLERQTAGPDKLMIIADDADVALLGTVVERLGPGLQGQISNPTYLEVTAAGVDKAATVLEYCAARGYRRTEVLAMGDGPNDLGLFAIAGVTVAPANARPEVLAAADVVAPSNDDGGVAWLLSRLTRLAER